MIVAPRRVSPVSFMSARTAASAARPRTGNVGRCVDGGPGLDLPPAEFEAEAPQAQAAPEASEGPAIDSRPLRSPVPSEIVMS